MSTPLSQGVRDTSKKRCAFRSFLKDSTEVAQRIWRGSRFHRVGAEAQKALSPKVLSLVRCHEHKAKSSLLSISMAVTPTTRGPALPPGPRYETVLS
ncbi:unnamed protein product [Boreogadus saida]